MSALADYTYAQDGIRKALTRWAIRRRATVSAEDRDVAVEMIIKELTSDWPKLLLDDDDVTVKITASQH